jgi:hypothetical protein
MVRVAVWLTPAPVAVMVTVVAVVTGPVNMLKPPAVEPCGTWTLGGIRARDGLLLVRKTWVSPGAAEANLTVPNEPFEPVVVVGLRVREVGGC